MKDQHKKEAPLAGLSGGGGGAMGLDTRYVPPIVGQAVITSTGSGTWTCPAGVFFVSVVCVGGGAGGGTYIGVGGGGLGYKNNISVTPGQSYNISVGAGGASGNNAGGDTWFHTADNNSYCTGEGGAQGSTSSTGTGSAGGSYYGDGGGNGGNGGTNDHGATMAGGGGAGGYSGNGGNGGNAGCCWYFNTCLLYTSPSPRD